MATMEHQVRAALDLLARYESVDRAEFSIKRIGDRTIATLLDHGLASEMTSLGGRVRYVITEEGRVRSAEPAPPKPPKRKPLTSLPPRLKTLDPMDRFKKK